MTTLAIPLRMYVLTIETERGAVAKGAGCWVASEAKVCARGFVNKVSQISTTNTKLEGLFAGFVLIIQSGFLRLWGLRSEICRLVPLHYVHYLTV